MTEPLLGLFEFFKLTALDAVALRQLDVLDDALLRTLHRGRRCVR